jgi:hypothetical protein
MAPGEAPADMSDGKLKTPPPIIEPTTSATNGSKVNLCAAGATGTAMPSVAAAIRIPLDVSFKPGTTFRDKAGIS